MTDREALIQLRVPAALKGRWVRESRAAGMKLTDWIISKVEPKKMNVYKIPESLASNYHGSGCGLVATVNGQVVDLVYVEDVLSDFSGEIADLPDAINDQRMAATVRRLQALGQVHVGMLSAWEFCEL